MDYLKGLTGGVHNVLQKAVDEDVADLCRDWRIFINFIIIFKK